MTIPCTSLADPAAVVLCNQQLELVQKAQTDTNAFFILWASALVLFMHAGFAMLSAGAVRSKNTKNILLSILLDMCVCCIAWYLVGFAFAFGSTAGGFIGSTSWVGIDVGSTPNGSTSFYFWLFEYAFAATAATIVSGAIAERARFDTYLVTSFWMSAWVYPVVAHWIWGGGFLTLGNPTGHSIMQSGVVDFAGCGPVHMVGGMAGFVGAVVMGPRHGRFGENGEIKPMPGHSSSLATLGTFILWIGWMGFNCGSVITLANGGGTVAARAGVNTVLSASAGALSALCFSHFLTKGENSYDLGMALNGALAGLVSITGCCAFVEMWAAIAIGFLGGIFYVTSSRLVLHVLKVDDPLDATAVHLFCGMWGIAAGAFFTNPVLIEPLFIPAPPDGSVQVPAGIFYGAQTFVTKYANGTVVSGGTTVGALVANATIEIVVVGAWVFAMSLPYFCLVQRCGVLRVAPDSEDFGLDESLHGGSAYPDLFHHVPTPPPNSSSLPQQPPQVKTSAQPADNTSIPVDPESGVPVAVS
ncbi:hypothetical protein BASA81_001206 [Batrachochytrium salamandrivorans]|nr:hypothetical protein BASA81_001206 [Batrachochytrium salamandrivorans]